MLKKIKLFYIFRVKDVNHCNMKTLLTAFIFTFLLISSTSCIATYRHGPAPEVVVIKHRPMNYKIVHVKGKKYYHWDNRHYRKVRGGYIEVRF